MNLRLPELNEPLRIGQILDRSFREARETVKQVLAPLIVIAILNGYGDAFRDESKTAEVLSVLFIVAGAGALIVSKILSVVFNYVFILMASEIWQGMGIDPRRALSKMRLRYLLRSVVLGIRFFFGVFLWSLLFLIPGLVYMMNRSLAFHILVIEDVTPGDAMKRSKFLMTREPWYSLSGTWMRLSALWILMLVLYLVSLVPLLLLNQASTLAASAGVGDLWSNTIVMFITYFIQALVTVFATIATIGFYFDLRVRYEGADLMGALDRLAVPETSIPTTPPSY